MLAVRASYTNTALRFRCANRSGSLNRQLETKRFFHHQTTTSSKNASSLWRRTPPHHYNYTQVRHVFTKRRKIPHKGNEGIKAKPVPLQKPSESRWRQVARYVKVVRLPFLIVTIYGLGYQQGIMDTVRNPLKLQQGLFESICIDMGVQSGEDIEIISERRPPPKLFNKGRFQLLEEEKKKDPRVHKVAIIGHQIIKAARYHVKQELQKAVEKAKEKLNDPRLTNIDLMKKVNEDEDVVFWIKALDRVEGGSVDSIQNWQYILIGTPIPNAFVAEALPQRFFVTTGLFDLLIENDDELAMVLGHEISHLIMGHSSERNYVDVVLRGIEVVVLMLDPTEGILSLGVAAFLASSRQALVAAHSRSHETQVDELGCKLAAASCFDTAKGARVFLKMHEFDVLQGSQNKDLMSSHPPSEERYEMLKKLAEDENASKHSYCSTLRDRIQRAFTIAAQTPP
jgi:Zn-dependent protease with chaperone function